MQNCKPDSTAPRVERNGGGGDTLSRGGQMGGGDVRAGGARMRNGCVVAIATLERLWIANAHSYIIESARNGFAHVRCRHSSYKPHRAPMPPCPHDSQSISWSTVEEEMETDVTEAAMAEKTEARMVIIGTSLGRPTSDGEQPRRRRRNDARGAGNKFGEW